MKYLNPIILSLLSEKDLSAQSRIRLEELKCKIESEAMSLAVIGQFKRGKSSLINALLGAEILPTGVLPLTAIITIVKYGVSKASVVFTSGETREIALTEIDRYAGELLNPQNLKQVQRVEISDSSPYLKNGVHVIDTPGIDSIYQHNSEVTLEFLPKADLALFVLSADQPLSENEVRFLLQAKQYLAKIIFVLNKIDYFNETEISEIVSFIQKNMIQKLGIENCEIFPVSAKNSLAARRLNDKELFKRSGIDKLEERLQFALQYQKEELLTASLSGKILGVIADEEAFNRIKERALQTDMGQLKEKIEKLQRHLDDIESKKREISVLFHDETKRFIDELTKFSIEETEKTIIELKISIRDLIDHRHGKVASAYIRGREHAAKLTKIESKKFAEVLNLKIGHDYTCLCSKFNLRVETLYREASEETAKNFDAQFSLSPPLQETSFDLKFGFQEFQYVPLATSLLQSLVMPLPAKYLKNKIIKMLNPTVEAMVRANFESSRWEYVKNLQLDFYKKESNITAATEKLKMMLSDLLTYTKKLAQNSHPSTNELEGIVKLNAFLHGARTKLVR